MITVRAVTPDRWADLEALAERPGPRGGTPILGHCWCQAFRGNEPSRPARKAAMSDLVSNGPVPGLIGYVDDDPRGWVSVAPAPAFRALERSSRTGEDLREAYAITCFYVEPGSRGEGLASALLDAAIDHARDSGAAAVLAFPKADLAAHATAGGRAEEAYSFMGRRASYEGRGFRQVRTAGKRLVMRLEL